MNVCMRVQGKQSSASHEGVNYNLHTHIHLLHKSLDIGPGTAIRGSVSTAGECSELANDDATAIPEPATETSRDHATGIRRALEQFAERVRDGRHHEPRRLRWRRACGRIGRAGR